MRSFYSILFALFVCSLYSSQCFAQEERFVLQKEHLDVIWVAAAAALVFFMQAGFALLESGMSRSKNCINVAMKNYTDVCLGSLFFWFIGFGLMFGDNPSGWIGESGFMLSEGETWDFTFLMFQTMFAATAVTIASGAMAERAKYSSYLIGAVIIIAIIYPVFGSWAWGSYFDGQGWLASLGFIDFAGSTVVHSVGGWCALAAITILGPRLGRFDRTTGEPRDIPGHNLSFVALGGFILWFGWFGFNGGSTLAADTSIGRILLNTQLAAAAGVVGSVFVAWVSRTPILVPTIVNGSLAGLVGITAGCASMSPTFAIVTGLTSGMLAYWFAGFLVHNGFDDVVSAVSVHAIAGAWGTLCAGAFYQDNLFDLNIIMIQALGVIACFAWSYGMGLIAFKLIDVIFGLRVDPLHEQRGLDFSEHAEVAYPEFSNNSFYTKDNLEGVAR